MEEARGERKPWIRLATESVKEHQEEYLSLARQLFDHPEIRFQERKSAALLMEYLKGQGFAIRKEAGGLPTAFTAVYGKGSPAIGFLGEYDALPGLSQEAGVAIERPVPGQGEAGHGCGHHLLGTGLIGAAVALKEALEKEKKEGTVLFYGCPAEEGGSGKVLMLREGVFDEAEILFTWHPEQMNRVSPEDVLATIVKEYHFHGKASHAASAPQQGRGALEGAELMGVGLGYLREHLPATARVHYAYLDAGGPALNVISPRASVAYQIRSLSGAEARRIEERIDDLARGAALMTGTEVQIRFQRASRELKVLKTLQDILYEVLRETGRAPGDPESESLAERLRETLPPEALGSCEEKARAMYGPEGEELAKSLSDKVLVDDIYPRQPVQVVPWASTDVGDVSHFRPVGYLNIACFPKDVPLHSWQAVAFGKSAFALEGMLTAASILGAAAIRLALEPWLAEGVKREWEKEKREEDRYGL